MIISCYQVAIQGSVPYTVPLQFCLRRQIAGLLTSTTASLMASFSLTLFKKAFDTIDHEIILRKMSYFGANQATVTWFQWYLSNRTQRCNVYGRLSTPCTITCGVPQGSILDPLIILMYINDLPNCLREASPRMFADDTNITLTAKTLTDLKP